MNTAILNKVPPTDAVKHSLKSTVAGTVLGVVLLLALPTIAPTVTVPAIGLESIAMIAVPLFISGLVMAYFWINNFYATMIVSGVLAAGLLYFADIGFQFDLPVLVGMLAVVFISATMGSVVSSPPSHFRRK